MESLVWDYKVYLEELGHKAVIINTNNCSRREIIDGITRCRPDIVHLHWEWCEEVLGKISAPVRIVTSHYTARDAREIAFFLLTRNFREYLENGLFYFGLSPVWVREFIDSGYNPSEVFVSMNGADHRRFRFREAPLHGNRTICLGKIQPRKRQHIVQTIDSIDFVGPMGGKTNFDKTQKNYLGEWTRNHLYEHLSDYANLVLLSESESCAPLVVLEALVCGLGVVVSPAAAVNLDTKLPWITVIPEEKITDTGFVEAEIARNREIALRYRRRIHEYGVANFSWEKLVPRYADLCLKLYDEKTGRQGFFCRKRDTLRRLCHALPVLRRLVRPRLLAHCPLWLRRLLLTASRRIFHAPGKDGNPG